MTDPRGEAGERRATDGLDWSRANTSGWAQEYPPYEPPAETPPVAVPAPAKRSTVSGLAIAIALVAALIGGIAGGAVVARFGGDGGNAGPASTAAPQVTFAAGTPIRVEISSAISEAAAAGRAAVVRVESRQRGRTTMDIGSGVLVDDDGHIVTNAT